MAGGEGSSTKIHHLVTDLKHQITSATSQVLSSALKSLEQKQPPSDTSTSRSGPEEGHGYGGHSDANNCASPWPEDSGNAAAGEEGLGAFQHFVTDIKHQITSATVHVLCSALEHLDKKQPPSEPEFTSRGVSEPHSKLAAERQPKIIFNLTDSEGDPSKDASRDQSRK